MDAGELYTAPCFIINLDRRPERYERAQRRITDAGFAAASVRRFKGVDAASDDLAAAWAEHGSPAFNPDDPEFTTTYPGKQGCMLSHLNVLKLIIKDNIKVATIFEDDVQFHKDWQELAPEYLRATPANFDLIYLGSQIDYMQAANILVTPVFCTHAYTITLAGAAKLYDFLVNHPDGVKTIDCMIIEYMKAVVFEGAAPSIIWYVWNATMFEDEVTKADPDWAKRNHGLVFQDPQFISDVRIWK